MNLSKLQKAMNDQAQLSHENLRDEVENTSTRPKKKVGPDRPLARENETQSQQACKDDNETQSQEADIYQKIVNSQMKLNTLQKKESSVQRVVKAAARLADRITEEDRAKFKDKLIECMDASRTFYSATEKIMITEPDHKTRLAAITLALAYDEGTPIQRVSAVVSHHTPASETVEKYRQSPAMMAAIKAASGMGMSLELQGEIIDIDSEIVDDETDVQKSPPEIPGVA